MQPWIAKHNVTATFKAPCRERWHVHYNARSKSWSLKFAFRYSFARATHRFLREGSSTKTQMCLALQRRALPNVRMRVSLQRRTQKCMNLSDIARSPSRNEKCKVLLQFWAIDDAFLARGLTESKWDLRFATVSGDRRRVFCERVARGWPRAERNLRFATVSCDRRRVFSERVDHEQMKFAFRYSFGRSTPRFLRKGCARTKEICVSLQFCAIDDAFLAKGLISGWPSPSRPAE